ALFLLPCSRTGRLEIDMPGEKSLSIVRSVTRATRRVELRGGARRLHARRTSCTLSVRPRAPTKQMGPSRRPRCYARSEQRAKPPPGQPGDEKGPAARRRPKAAREAYFLYVERAAEGANEADGPLSSPWSERQPPLDEREALLGLGVRPVEHDPPLGEDAVGPGEREGEADILLDQQHGEPARGQVAQHAVDGVDHLRSESLGGLVEQHDVGIAHERAGDREHLLLAPG